MKTTVAKALVSSLLCTMIMTEVGAWLPPLPSSFSNYSFDYHNRDTQLVAGSFATGMLVLGLYRYWGGRRRSAPTEIHTTEKETETKDQANLQHQVNDLLNQNGALQENLAINAEKIKKLEEEVGKLTFIKNCQLTTIEGNISDKQALSDKIKELEDQRADLIDTIKKKDKRIDSDKDMMIFLNRRVNQYRCRNESESKRVQDLRHQLLQVQDRRKELEKLKEANEIFQQNAVAKDRAIDNAQNIIASMKNEINTLNGTLNSIEGQGKRRVVRQLVEARKRVKELGDTRIDLEKQLAGTRETRNQLSTLYQAAYHAQASAEKRVGQLTQSRDGWEGECDFSRKAIRRLQKENLKLAQTIAKGKTLLAQQDATIGRLFPLAVLAQLLFSRGLVALIPEAQRDIDPEAFNTQNQQSASTKNHPLVLYTKPPVRSRQLGSQQMYGIFTEDVVSEILQDYLVSDPQDPQNFSDPHCPPKQGSSTNTTNEPVTTIATQQPDTGQAEQPTALQTPPTDTSDVLI